MLSTRLLFVATGRRPAIGALVLLLSVFVTNCGGQSNMPMPEGSTGKPQTTPASRERLTKTQGTTPFDNVHCGLRDKAGNLWFGTTSEGVYRYDGKGFTNLTVKDGLGNNSVFCIVEDGEGHLWFGTRDVGLSRYDGRTFTGFSASGSQR